MEFTTNFSVMNCCPNEQPQVAAGIEDLELHLGCDTCWLSYFTMVCLWLGRRAAKTFLGDHFLGEVGNQAQNGNQAFPFCFQSFLSRFSWPPRFSFTAVGSFSIDDGNGSENVSFKMNSRFFNLWYVYSNLLKMASVGEFPWSWFLEDRTQWEKKRFVVACLRPP